MKVVWLLLFVLVLGLGCFSPDVDVDTSGLRPAVAQISTARSSRTSGSDPGSATASRVEDLEEDVAKLEKKLDGLKDDLEELEDRVKKLEKKLD